MLLFNKVAPPAKSQVSLKQETMRYLTRYLIVIHQSPSPFWPQTLRGNTIIHIFQIFPFEIAQYFQSEFFKTKVVIDGKSDHPGKLTLSAWCPLKGYTD